MMRSQHYYVEEDSTIYTISDAEVVALFTANEPPMPQLNYVL